MGLLAVGLPLHLIAPAVAVSAPRVAGGSAPVHSEVALDPVERAPVASTASAAAVPGDIPATLVERFGLQMRASQSASDPASLRWALLIGINEQAGRVADNYGSRQDAEDLRKHLLNLGWRNDHIMLITDFDATRSNIIGGMRWLASKTTSSSVAVFHYSGHSKKWYGQDFDGDGEVTDEGLWPTDDRFIVDSEVVRELAPVKAAAFWLNFSTCNAAGFNDPGLARTGRVLTFSSREAQKSYENPDWKNSVWGYYQIDQGLLRRKADGNNDGLIPVEEAFRFAAPHATYATSGQSKGRQDPVLVDDLAGEFLLEIPGTPRKPGSEPGKGGGGSKPAPADDEDDSEEESRSILPCVFRCDS